MFRCRWARLPAAAAIAVTAALASAPARAVDVDYPSLFGTAETRSDNLKPFTKWTGMLERFNPTSAGDPGPCTPAGAPRCRTADWHAFLRAQTGKTRREQIDAVNVRMNRHPYIEDLPNWGVLDYWATPREFLVKDGDCEDYAIAKYMSLRLLGFPDSQLRLVVLQDLNLGIAHAVLVVYLDGKTLLLDNQIKQVVETDKVRHYRPLFSINERYWWLHKSPPPAASRVGGATPIPDRAPKPP